MTQSPPKAQPKEPSSRPPTTAVGAGGRLTTALAAGGSVLVLSTIAVVLWPRTYGTEGTFAVDGAPPASNPTVLAGRIEAALLERQELSSIAMELPPELRAPDPIGRLRAGIRVQSHGGQAYGVEFRGSDEQSVQRIANRLLDRAVALLPQIAASPEDKAPVQALAQRTRAVTEFLTAHPEMSLEATGGKPAAAATDSGLEALRTEKRQIEQRLTTGAPDNPYGDPDQTPEILNRRLAELKTTIARREKALREPHPVSAPNAAPELVTQWRALLADLAAAQTAASAPSAAAPVSGHVLARAPLPSSPLTPNRLVLSIVAVLLSAAAAMAAYALPRFVEPTKRTPLRPKPQNASDPPPRPDAVEPALKPSEPALKPSEPPAPLAAAVDPTPAAKPSTQPAKGSDPPPARAGGSEPPGPIAVQRTVVVRAAPTTAPLNTGRGKTVPGGLEGPQAAALAKTAVAPAPAPAPGLTSPHVAPAPAPAPVPVPANAAAAAAPAAGHPPAPAAAHSPPAAPLFGSRPPPGAGSYSVSSSHPPAMDSRSGAVRTSVERLSPLQSAHPPAQSAPASRRGTSPVPQAASGPQIMSLPPALDPDAEIWAARFETPPPPPPEAEPTPQAPVPAAPAAPAVAEPPAEPPSPEADPEPEGPRKRARWKTQVMGSMVPLEVTASRERAAESEQPDSLLERRGNASFEAPAGPHAVLAPARFSQVEPVRRQAPTPMASTIIQQDMPLGWKPNIDAPLAEIIPLSNAVLKEASSQRLTLLVTGSATLARAHFAGALGFAISESGARVLLIEADFDSPALHRALAFTAPAGAGFSQQLMARRQARHPEPWVVMRCSANLHVLGEGRFRSPGLVASREFENAIQELREQYHVVIVHGPSLAKSEDLRPLAFQSQGVVVVRTGQPASAHFGDDALRAIG